MVSAVCGVLVTLIAIYAPPSVIADTVPAGAVSADAIHDAAPADATVSEGDASCAVSSLVQKNRELGRIESESLAEQPGHGKSPARPLAPMNESIGSKLGRLAEFEKEMSTNSTVAEEAERVEADLVAGRLAPEEDIVDLVNDFSSKVSAEDAAEDGIEFTHEDLIELHHGVNMEAKSNDTFQGDMMPRSASQKALFMQIAAKHGSYSGAGKPWPGGLVKYCLAPDLPSSTIKAWQLSIDQYKKVVPCLQWKDVGYSSNNRCRETGAIFVRAWYNDGCWSYVGRTYDDYQAVQLETPGCDSVGTVMHEIGHALGLAHEQSRPDRDQYVSVDFDNTVEDAQFTVSSGADTKQPYDILSLMHYGVEDFATDRSKPVIIVKPKAYEKYTSDPAEFEKYQIGNRIGLSQTDADSLADMYDSVVPGGCKASRLGKATTCVDKKKNGADFRDGYGDCEKYRATSTANDPCSQYSAGMYCCGCGGGWEVQSVETVPTYNLVANNVHCNDDSPGKYLGMCGSGDVLAKTLEDCQSACDAREGCRYISWVPNHGSYGNMYRECTTQNHWGRDVYMQAPTTTTTTTTTSSTTTTTTQAATKAGQGCADSTTYADPGFGDACPNWEGYDCSGYDFSAELMQNCPVACGACPTASACADSTTYADPSFGDQCPAWEGFKCSGYDFSDTLMRQCPRACGQC